MRGAVRFASRERLSGRCPRPASEDPEEVKNGMWEHIKENKILAIGFVVCMILASYVSQKKALEKEQAEQAAADAAAAEVQAQKQAEQQLEDEDEENDDTSMRLPSGEVIYINIA